MTNHVELSRGKGPEARGERIALAAASAVRQAPRDGGLHPMDQVLVVAGLFQERGYPLDASDHKV
jgi:hypothetical protein